jgi:hypothetical protein
VTAQTEVARRTCAEIRMNGFHPGGTAGSLAKPAFRGICREEWMIA